MKEALPMAGDVYGELSPRVWKSLVVRAAFRLENTKEIPKKRLNPDENIPKAHKFIHNVKNHSRGAPREWFYKLSLSF